MDMEDYDENSNFSKKKRSKEYLNLKSSLIQRDKSKVEKESGSVVPDKVPDKKVSSLQILSLKQVAKKMNVKVEVKEENEPSSDDEIATFLTEMKLELDPNDSLDDDEIFGHESDEEGMDGPEEGFDGLRWRLLMFKEAIAEQKRSQKSNVFAKIVEDLEETAEMFEAGLVALEMRSKNISEMREEYKRLKDTIDGLRQAHPSVK